MIRYAVTVFISAFLLFQVQPMVAKFILPWFGGSSLVWTTCMLFFQVALVGGYAYSHFIATRLSPRAQWILHLVLVFAALATLPIRPDDSWKPVDGNFPTPRILWLLTAGVGLPFFVLSTTGPLIQKWQSQTHPDRSPFRLFALSNFASLLALVSYPFVVERFLTLDQQSWTWSMMFGLFVAAVALSGYLFQKNTRTSASHDQPIVETEEPYSIVSILVMMFVLPILFVMAVPSIIRVVVLLFLKKKPVVQSEFKLGFLLIVLWILLPMLASVQLLATTNLMTQEIGSHPFLWILPLGLYLSTFIICFEHDRWYYRPIFFVGLFLSAVYSCFVIEAGIHATVPAQVIGYSAVLFYSAMCCHGELTRLKPSSRHLTLFYLLISIGGALGGIFVALVAPLIFINFYEFHLSLIAVILVTVCCYLGADTLASMRKPSGLFRLASYTVTLIASVATLCFVGASFVTYWRNDRLPKIISHTRNEYGTLTVTDNDFNRRLTNGRIEHGFQVKGQEFRLKPTSYYGPTSGLGLAIRYMQDWSPQKELLGTRIGAIGLGTGTIAAWGRPGDAVHFFEINPAVQKIAENDFTYVQNCKARLTITLGDARVQLEREAATNSEPLYDVLVADAFASDSIPMHLLTLEAMELYKKRIKPDGIIAIHTSNRFLKLENIVRRLADAVGMKSVIIADEPDFSAYNRSTWVLVTNNEDFLQNEMVWEGETDWPDSKYTAFWTDDFASLIPVMRMDWGDFEWFQDVWKAKTTPKIKKETKK